MPAREEEIRAKVMHHLHDTGIPTPDYIRVLCRQAGSDESVKADCNRMARELDASVLICDPDGKIFSRLSGGREQAASEGIGGGSF